MRKEPDIVNILREEERTGQLHMKMSGSCEEVQESQDSFSDTSDDSITMVTPTGEQYLSHSISQAHLEAIHKTLFETFAVAILVVDPQGRIISWNTSAETLLGITKKEFLLKSITSLYPPDEWLKLISYFKKETGLRHHIETKILTKQKELLDVALSVNILKNNEGKHLGSLHIIDDISEQKKAERWLTSIIEYADDSVYLLDPQYRYLMVNNELLSRLGCSRDEVLGKTFGDFHSADETKEFAMKLSWVLEHGRPLKDEHCKDGNWFLRTLSPVKDTIAAHTTAILVVSKDITEQKKAGEMLLEKEKKYRTMFEFFPQLIVLLDSQGTLVDVNGRIEEWLGYKPVEIIGKNIFSLPFFTKETILSMKKNFSERMSNKKVPPYEIEVRTKRGEKRVGIVHATPLKDDQNEIIADLVVVSDITERKHMDEVLRIKDSAITSSINAIALADLEGNLTYVNKSFLSMWGYSKEKDVIGKPIVQFWKMKGQYKEVMDALAKKGVWIGELTGIRKDHLTFQVQFSANMITDEYDKPICMMGSFVDITKYKKAAKALSESENKFRVVLENSLDMIYQLNLKKETCDYVSPSCLKVVGYSSEEMTSFGLKKIEEFIHPEDRDRLNQHLKMITDYRKRRDSIQAVEYRFKHKTMGYRWMSDTRSAIFDDKHSPIAIVGNVEDITDRKKVWDELVKSEEKYRILAETSADGVFTTDALGRLTYVNPSFEKLCERRKSQILATPFRNYLLEDSIYFFQQIFIDVRKKNEKIENVELELVAADGRIIPIEVNIAPLKKEEFSGVVCTVRDITQRRDVEDELKKNERLKTEFMNIAAHELRSPVTPIKGYLDLIIHDNESNEKIKSWAKISLRNAERLLKLVNDILDVARLDSDTMRLDMEKIDPVELLTEIAEDMKPAIANKKLEFRINIPTSLPHIMGDKNRLSQVLKNLIGNALKFTDYGFIGIEVDKKDNHMLISVVDSGIGISKDEIKKIFTKFYQAYTGEDRNNEGTGLGLFISKEIVKKHNGTIWAESEVGKGSRFVIQLPYIYKMTVDFAT
jgi:PAS domain S-box-containing protein